MLLLGIDVGTSFIKVSVIDSQTTRTVATCQYPETESDILSIEAGWAEQSPDMWWDHVVNAIQSANNSGRYNPLDIGAIGIAYQMHGMVLVDKEQQVLRNAIIWCDSRAVSIGDQAFLEIGEEKSLTHLLNSPGNFTASKLAWVKHNEPELYDKVDKIMLPGDYIAMKLTGELSSSVSSLSEGIFWDFKHNEISKDIMNCFGFDERIIPEIKSVFSIHGLLRSDVADKLQLKQNIPVSYKSGDQPNNALALNVLEPGEIAATAGTSGVIYGVTDQLTFDRQSRVNTFAHVNHSAEEKRLGVLLCINGTGIMNKWARNMYSEKGSYSSMNDAAAKVDIGSNGLRVLPFGNGAERMLKNKLVGAHILDIDLNIHSKAHTFRAVQEGIAFSFRYGLDILRENNIHPRVIRAGKSNLFMSELFVEAFVNATHVPIELYTSDGSVGAALGAGIGVRQFSIKEAFRTNEPLQVIKPQFIERYESVYQHWKSILDKRLDEID